ncbi:MAG TPA: SET domain-containing protein [Bryobacteraceae bacterium]|nr:SET domain-containing protein [Bryobacteraceae bacterium]
MIHPSTQIRFIDNQIGYGVFALGHIPCGTVAWAPDALDQVFTPVQTESLPEAQRSLLEKYGFVRRDGSLVLYWDARRFMNHSCSPNTLITKHGYEIAVKDIQPGDQLTCDYGALHIKRRFSCRCQDPECRSVVHPEDFMVCSSGWRQATEKALSLLDSVKQPLGHLIDRERLPQDFASLERELLTLSV